jgi:hypothetical protein
VLVGTGVGVRVGSGVAVGSGVGVGVGSGVAVGSGVGVGVGTEVAVGIGVGTGVGVGVGNAGKVRITFDKISPGWYGTVWLALIPARKNSIGAPV